MSLRVARRLGAVAVAGDATSLHLEGLGFGTFSGKLKLYENGTCFLRMSVRGLNTTSNENGQGQHTPSFATKHGSDVINETTPHLQRLVERFMIREHHFVFVCVSQCSAGCQ